MEGRLVTTYLLRASGTPDDLEGRAHMMSAAPWGDRLPEGAGGDPRDEPSCRRGLQHPSPHTNAVRMPAMLAFNDNDLAVSTTRRLIWASMAGSTASASSFSGSTTVLRSSHAHRDGCLGGQV